jgi:Protein of unknown function (DUF3105)
MRTNTLRTGLVVVSAVSALIGVSGACGGNITIAVRDDAGTTRDAAKPTPDSRTRFDAAVEFESGTCNYQLASPPLLDSPHVDIGSPLTFHSNPPSSGPHYPVWAAFREYQTPVPRGYTLHSLEHGAIVIGYRCDSAAACPDLAASLRSLVSEFPDDPLCDPSVKKRIVLVPDPLLATRIGIAAWGFTYTSECVDAPSIRTFMRENYARATENFCTQGQTDF